MCCPQPAWMQRFSDAQQCSRAPHTSVARSGSMQRICHSSTMFKKDIANGMPACRSIACGMADVPHALVDTWQRSPTVIINNTHGSRVHPEPSLAQPTMHDSMLHAAGPNPCVRSNLDSINMPSFRRCCRRNSCHGQEESRNTATGVPPRQQEGAHGS